MININGYVHMYVQTIRHTGDIFCFITLEFACRICMHYSNILYLIPLEYTCRTGVYPLG